MLANVGAVLGSLLYAVRTWPGSTLFITIFVVRLLDWQGAAGAGAYAAGLALAAVCVVAAWRGDDYLDLACKAAVDLQTGWKELSSGYLSRFGELEFVPVTILPAEAGLPLVVLPGGMRAYLPPLGDILAFWVRRPPAGSSSDARVRLPVGPRAYPLASYRNYVFIPFDPAAASAEQRFQLFHEFGHALYARSFASIGQVQVWPSLLLLTIGLLVIEGPVSTGSWVLAAMLVTWQGVALLRSVPQFERVRYSELCADFYALLHSRGESGLRPFLAKLIAGLRLSPDPADNHRAADLEMMAEALQAEGDNASATPAPIEIEKAALFHRLLVALGSQHPAWLAIPLAASLATSGLAIVEADWRMLLAFAAAYGLLPYLLWRFGTGRRSALEGFRTDRFLRQRQPAGGDRTSLRLVFS